MRTRAVEGSQAGLGSYYLLRQGSGRAILLARAGANSTYAVLTVLALANVGPIGGGMAANPPGAAGSDTADS